MKNVLLYAELSAEESPKQPFYRLSVEKLRGQAGFVILKRSGYGDKVHHLEKYYRGTYESARLFWRKKIDQKINPNRHRVYTIKEVWEKPEPTSRKAKVSNGFEQPELFDM